MQSIKNATIAQQHKMPSAAPFTYVTQEKCILGFQEVLTPELLSMSFKNTRNIVPLLFWMQNCTVKSASLLELAYNCNKVHSLFINHVDRFLDIFDTPFPPLWTILLNKAYVVIWTSGTPLSHSHVYMVYECPHMKHSNKL